MQRLTAVYLWKVFSARALEGWRGLTLWDELRTQNYLTIIRRRRSEYSPRYKMEQKKHYEKDDDLFFFYRW